VAWTERASPALPLSTSSTPSPRFSTSTLPGAPAIRPIRSVSCASGSLAAGLEQAARPPSMGAQARPKPALRMLLRSVVFMPVSHFRDEAGAVAEAVLRNAEALEQGQVQVRQRRAFRQHDVAATLDQAIGATDQYFRQ